MRLIAIANTHFQLITLINLRYSLYSEDYMDIIVSDEISGYIDIAERLKKTHVFDNVYTAKAVKLFHGKLRQRQIEFIKAIIFSFSYLKKICDIEDKEYDCVLFDNTDSLFTHCVFNYLEKTNKNIRGIFFEEAVGVCSERIHVDHYRVYKLLHMKNKIFKRNSIDKSIDAYLLFQPDYLKEDIDREKLIKIPNLPAGDRKFTDIINEVYDYKNFTDDYRYKYIFFEESFISNAGEEDVNDFDLIEELTDVLGKDNVLIKRHPRNKINRFKDKGIHFNSNLSMPWEVILLNQSFDESVFFTISSTAVINAKLYFASGSKIYMLMNCTDKILERQKTLIKTVLNVNEIKKDSEPITIVQDRKAYSELLQKMKGN